jgi:hypothetical protein
VGGGFFEDICLKDDSTKQKQQKLSSQDGSKFNKTFFVKDLIQ